MKTLRILMLNHEFPPIGGGAAPVTLELCKYLAQKGHTVDVVTMHYGDLPRFETIEGVNVYRTPAIRKKPNICHTYEMATYAPGALKRILKLVKQNCYNVIHCHFLIPGGPLALMVSKMTRTPYVVTAHGSDVPGFNPDRFQFQHKLTKPILRAVCNGARKIVSPSLYLKGLIEENIGPYPIEHIPNGIDLQSFNLDLSRPKENIILSTGRLLKRKGFHTLIKAVHNHPLPFEVHIAGDGPYREELERLAQSSKTKIVFHGWLTPHSEELMDLYTRASVYVLASSHENASISLLEGMAARCVTVTTNVSGCPETVGDAGFLIDVGDTSTLQQILTRLAEHKELLTSYAAQAYERVVKEYSLEKVAQRYIQTYNED